MTREGQILFLAVLTLVVYAASIYLEKGMLLFPFPLNEIVFFIVALQFAWWNRTRTAIYIVVVSTLWVLSTPFFWSLVYGHQMMEAWSKNLLTDYFLLSFYMLVLTAGIIQSIRQKTRLTSVFGAVFLFTLCTGVWTSEPWLILLAAASMAISSFIRPVFQPFHLLWLLFALLKGTEVISFTLHS